MAGGVQRAFWSERLRGAKFKFADARKAFFCEGKAVCSALKQAGGEEYERLRAIGKSATITNLIVARAFGQCSKNPTIGEGPLDGISKRPRVGEFEVAGDRRVAAGFAELFVSMVKLGPRRYLVQDPSNPLTKSGPDIWLEPSSDNTLLLKGKRSENRVGSRTLSEEKG